MKKFFYDRRIVFMYLFTIIFLMVGMTYALQSTSLSLGLTTALVGIDENAYGNTDFDSSQIDFKPILDTEVETSPENVIKIEFAVGGAKTNNNENIIYDIALNNLNVNCNLISPYIKWKLIKEGIEISSGSLDYKFDTIDENGRLVLTTIQENLSSYSSTRTNYDDYIFYMWFSDSCQSNDITECTTATDQSKLIGQNLSGKIEVELYTESQKELIRNPGTTTTDSLCDGAYAVSFITNGGSVESSISVATGSAYGELPIPTKTTTITFDTLGGSDIIEVNNTSVADTFIIGTSNTYGISPKIKLLSDTNSKSITYTFEGWYSEKELTNQVTDETIVTKEKNHDLYAKWSGDNKITLPSVTKAYNEFLGWYSDKELKVKIGDAGDTYEAISDKTLYAGWKSSYLTINLKNNGGTGGPSAIYVVSGDGFYSDETLTNKITQIETLPTRTGYTFQGYEGLTDSEGNITASTEDYSQSTTISAIWTANNYKALFISNGGNITNGKNLTNLITDGSFEQETSAWTLSNASIVTTKQYSGQKSLTFTTGTTSMSRQTLSQSAPTLNHLYYGRLMFLSESGFSVPDARFEWYNADVDQARLTFFQKSSDTNGEWKILSGIKSITSSTYLSNSWGIRNFTVNSTTNSYVDDLIIVDLTSDFGEGSEIENLDLLDKIPFFETNESVFVKEMTYNTTYGDLPSSSKDGYVFSGWYTELTGGTNVTNTTLFKETSDKVLYAHYTNVSLEATKMTTGTKVTSANWSDEGLNFVLTRTGEEDFKIYYCQDTSNTCEPTIVINSGEEITTYNTETGTYYLRYKIATDSGLSSDIYSYTAKVDLSVPVLSMTSGNYELTNTGNVYSATFGLSSGTVSCYNTSRSNASVTTYASIGTLGSNTVTCTATSGAGNSTTASATFYINWTVASEKIYATGTAYKSGTSVVVPNGGTQYGPYIPTNQGCYQVIYTGSNMNKYYNGYQAYSNGTSFEMTRLNYVDTDANYFIKVPSDVDTLETVFVNNGTYDITVSSIRITYQGEVSSCPDAYTYSITLDQQGATTSGTTSVTAAYLGELPTITSLPKKSYTVSYNGNGGTVTTSSTANYQFNGYYSAMNGSGTQYYNSSGVGVRTYNINGNSTLYASWTSSSITLATPSREGYSFLGWYDSSGTYVGTAGSSYTPTSDISLTAYWVEAVWYISSSKTYQNTLANAINAASSTDTLTLQKDVTDSTGAITKNLTINTNGKTWTRNAVVNIDSTVTVTITGSGTIQSTNSSILIANYGTTTINYSGTMTSGDIGIYNLGIMYITTVNVACTTTSPAILNVGQLRVNGGTCTSLGNCLQNGTENSATGTVWLLGGKFITTGTGTGAIKNFSDEAWPTTSTTGKIHYCTKGCTVHIGGTTKVSNTGTKYAVQNQAMTNLGFVHFPSDYTGYVHAKNNYVLRAYQGDIVMNGGNVYAEANKDFSSAGDNAIINWQDSVNIYYGEAPTD